MTVLTIPIPDAPVTGSDFGLSILNVSHQAREHTALNALLQGNVPSWMRTFVEVTTTFKGTDGSEHTLTMNVLPDGVTVGTDDDFMRMPLWPLTAQRLCDEWNCVLPTTKMVSLIWDAAQKMKPHPWGPPFDETMQDTGRFIIHNRWLSDEFCEAGFDHSLLVAGHKKDIVLSKGLVAHPTSVAIFGWHQLDGTPIQPLFLGHSNNYSDYSHLARLVSKDCTLDGEPDDFGRILQDQVLCVGVSNEGPLPILRQPGV